MEPISRNHVHNSDAVSSDLIEITEYPDVTIYKRYKYIEMRKVYKQQDVASLFSGGPAI